MATGWARRPANYSKRWRKSPSLDVVMPTGAGKDLRLRIVSRPEQHLARLWASIGRFPGKGSFGMPQLRKMG